ncbi:hypothetical protein J3R83DRAFT_2289 [Lanmaoa asiatica]|nr:hypothetical protein J3R83DRAFT_2289 [Lanmaoa asiatica]
MLLRILAASLTVHASLMKVLAQTWTRCPDRPLSADFVYQEALRAKDTTQDMSGLGFGSEASIEQPLDIRIGYPPLCCGYLATPA